MKPRFKAIAVARIRGYLCLLALTAALAACAQTSVVRESGHRGKPVPGRTANRPANRPKPGAIITVRKGDTMYRLAVENGVSPLDLAMWNRIPPPYTIYPGQRLRLSPPRVASVPTPARPAQPAASTTKPPVTSTAKPPAGAGTTASAQVGAPAAGSTAAGSKPPAVTPTPPPAVAQAAFVWRWPADGSIVGRFSASDPTKQGIDIAGLSGAPVRAAADGVVVYSGAGLVGYGELIIVKHSEQWLSAYGHNRARLVNEGQRVKAGEQIAEMGRSGAARDMLHFEIRYNGKPQDPLLALPKR
jgi:lipoprotein NlpD